MDKYEEREYLKSRLAAVYRIFGHFGLNEDAAGHITVRDFVFGVDFNFINKSDFLRVNHEGNIFDYGRVKLFNKAAFLISGAIHTVRLDVLCAAHAHSVYGRAYYFLNRPIDIIILESCVFYNVRARHFISPCTKTPFTNLVNYIKPRHFRRQKHSPRGRRNRRYRRRLKY
jgi:ribulose-5-phosphate 4-epimerase/fuculose-1-phosphate aldolase